MSNAIYGLLVLAVIVAVGMSSASSSTDPTDMDEDNVLDPDID